MRSRNKTLWVDNTSSHREINGLIISGHRVGAICYNREFMVQLFLAVLGALRVFFRSRSDTALEILALRQQVAVLKRQRPRPPLNSGDRFCWTTLRRFWSRWTDVLLILKPETVPAGDSGPHHRPE